MQITVTNLMQNTNIWVQDSDSISSEARPTLSSIKGDCIFISSHRFQPILEKTFLYKKKDILTKCAALAFFATLLLNLNIKGAKVWSTGAQDGEGTAEEEKDRGGQAWR